jgi:hypothetical protein
MKVCCKCDTKKELGEFYSYELDRIRSRCKKCMIDESISHRNKRREELEYLRQDINVSVELNEKTCRKCKQVKDITQFPKCSKLKNEKSSYCKQCHVVNAQRWAEQNPERVLLKSAKLRATAQSVPFNISVIDISIPETCPICDTVLESGIGKGQYYPHAPSLDKIEPAKGYVKGNVWVICKKCNIKKHDMTVDSMREFANRIEYALNQLRISQ